MSNWNGSGLNQFTYTEQKSLTDIRPLMRLVYMWMGFGLLTTAVISLVVASTSLVEMAAQIYMPLIIVEFVIVIALSWGISRMSPGVAGMMFFVYAAINGLVFGVIFFALEVAGKSNAITPAFLTTAGLFGAMTVIGFTTKVDLSKYSTFFMMGLIGLFIAIIVNAFFVQSGAMGLIISVIGVILFTALTAWDTQKIKNMAMLPEYQTHSDSMAKMAIMGALMLYLDFINIFIFLLQLFAGGRD